MRHATRLLRGFIQLQWFLFRPSSLVVTNCQTDVPRVWLDVSNSFQSPRTTGVERTTREISRATKALEDEFQVTIYFFRTTLTGKAYQVNPGWASDSPPGSIKHSTRPVEFSNHDSIFLLDLSLPPGGFTLRDVNFLQSQGALVTVMVYDVLPVTHPKFFPPGRSLVFRQWLRIASAARNRVYISEATRRGYRRATKTPTKNNHDPNEIVVRLGSFSTSGAKPHRREPTHTGPQEVLAIGTLEPRKDYPGILDALEWLWDQDGSYRLTIVGREGWKCRRLLRRIQRHPELGKKLFWLDDCDDRQLRKILESSNCLIANSIDEGFGLPLIEAAEAGVPVAARDIDVFREIVPNAFFFKGDSPEGMGQKIIEACNAQFANSTTRDQHSRYAWTDAARQILALMLRDLDPA